MRTWQTKSVAVLALVLALLATWNYYIEAQSRPDRPLDPFRVLGTQENPPVTLFEHRPSGTCYLGWKAGGLIAVDTEVCKRHGFLLPLILSKLPVESPER